MARIRVNHFLPVMIFISILVSKSSPNNVLAPSSFSSVSIPVSSSAIASSSSPLSLSSSPSSPSSDSSVPEMLYIRHGRSRVRHSNEKDHLRWGLQALDNLTLDYDIDEFDNDSVILFGSDLWAATSENGTYLNSSYALNNYSNNTFIFVQKGFSKQTLVQQSQKQPQQQQSLKQHQQLQQNEDKMQLLQVFTTPVLPMVVNYTPTKRKKLQKKKIMENIRKNVDKGLEYLKMHKDLDVQNTNLNLSPVPLSGAQASSNSPHPEHLLNPKRFESFPKSNRYEEDEQLQNDMPIHSLDSDESVSTTIATTSNVYVANLNSIGTLSSRENNYSVELERENNKNLPHTVPARLTVTYHQQKVAKGIMDNNGMANTEKKNIENKDVAHILGNLNSEKVKNKNTSNSSPLLGNNKHHHYQQHHHRQSYSRQHFNKLEHQKSNVDGSNLQSGKGKLLPMASNSGLTYENNANFDLEQKANKEREDINDDMKIFRDSSRAATIEHNILMENNHDDNVQGKQNDDDGSEDGEVSDSSDANENGDNDEPGNQDDDQSETFTFDATADGIALNVHGTSEEDLTELDEISRNNRLNLMKGRDVVTKFLQIVESQHLLGANCTAGTALNLGEGVVDQYAQDRFRVEAEIAVNRANMLTRIFKLTSPSVQASEHLLHASVLSMVEFDDDIFAAGNCFDWNQHPSKKGLFCPFAYRLPPPDQGASLAKDLAAEYHYLGNTSEWFFLARKNAEKVIARNEQYIKAYHLYSNSTYKEADEILSVRYEDGRWSKPYYDCGGGNIWMLTYTVPFFGYENGTYFFKGTSGIDIDLRRVDIDQCPQRFTLGTTQPLNIFAGTDKCKQRTTMCEAITGLGFRRGSYKCICRKGFYFPDTTASQKFFNGSILEEEYEKLMLSEESTYNKPLTYECLPCAEGCDYCEDASPCVAALNWPMRTSILVLACAVIGLLPPAAWFTFRYQQVKVVRAASPALLRVIALGAFFIYCTTIVMYPPPSLYTCTARIWLREIGFSLTYGALMLKTWRISVIFRVRSAKAVKITDAALLKRLGMICGVIGACLLVRTVVSPPEVVVGRTADDLKAFLCKTDWWDYTFTSMEVLFLAWGVRLCIMVRKAPSEFNESRFISMAIYNEFLLTCFLNVSMLFLQSPANPDLLYIIFFCHTQLTVTLLLALIFGSKVYIVLRSGKSQDNAISMGAKSSGAKFNFRPQIRTFANPSTATSSTAQLADTKLSDQEALEEIHQLSVQLQRIQELAPPKGIAVMTISSLLDGLRTTSQQLSIKAQSSSSSSAHILPILPVNSEFDQSGKPNCNVKHSTTKISSEQSQTLEKSMNTDLTGEEFMKEIQQSDLVCANCRGCNEDVEQNTEDIPHPNNICLQLEGQTESNITNTNNNVNNNNSNNNNCDLTFTNLQLECMCSQSDDLDCCYLPTSSCRLALDPDPDPDPGLSLQPRMNYTCGRSTSCDQSELNKSSNVCETNSTESNKQKFYSACNLSCEGSRKQHPQNAPNSEHCDGKSSIVALVGDEMKKHCDSHNKSIEHFLLCDFCKNKLLNISIKSPDEAENAISQKEKYKENREELRKITKDISEGRRPSEYLHYQQYHRTPCTYRYLDELKKTKSNDDISSFYSSTSNDESDNFSMRLKSFDNDTNSTTSTATAIREQYCHQHHHHHNHKDVNTYHHFPAHHKQQPMVVRTTEIHVSDSDNLIQTTLEDSKNNDNSKTDSETNLNSFAHNEGDGESSTPRKGRSRKPDKFVLDLNDRSKYTKEVSV